MKYLVGMLCAASVAVMAIVVWLGIGLSSRVVELEAKLAVSEIKFQAITSKYLHALDVLERRQTSVETSLRDSNEIVEASKMVQLYNDLARPRRHRLASKKRRRRGLAVGGGH